METQTLDNSITFKGFVISCIIFIPHFLYSIYSFFKFLFRKKYLATIQSQNIFLRFLEGILFVIELLLTIDLAILLLPIYALFDIYILTVSYSQQPFAEATEEAFGEFIDAILIIFELTHSDS